MPSIRDSHEAARRFGLLVGALGLGERDDAVRHATKKEDGAKARNVRGVVTGHRDHHLYPV